jgi:hypothetical protein
MRTPAPILHLAIGAHKGEQVGPAAVNLVAHGISE